MTQDVSLDTLEARRAAEIVAVDWSVLVPEEAKRLRALGIEEGAEVEIAHRGIFGGRDPLALKLGRMVIAVRRSHAAAMTVRHK